jgi:hypothetical protein
LKVIVVYIRLKITAKHYSLKIEDYSKALFPKGRQRIETDKGIDYVDSPDMYDLIPYELKTSKELIEQELFNNKRSIYTYPHRFRERYESDLTTYVGDTKCLL